MSIRKTACLAIVCLLLTSLGVFCQTKEIPPQTDKALAGLVKFRPGIEIDPEVIQKLVDKIIKDNVYLSERFAARDFIAVAERLGERGTSLLTPGYEKMWGGDSAGFWRDSAAGGATLMPVVVAIYITDAVGRQTIDVCVPNPETKVLTPGRITYNYVASVTQEFHVIKSGTVIHNATGVGDEIYRHQDTCVWE